MKCSADPQVCGSSYEIDEHEDQPSIVMRFLEGRTLKHRIGGGDVGARRAVPLPLDTLLGLAIQIADALEAAQAKGIVHCWKRISPWGADAVCPYVDLFASRRAEALRYNDDG